MPQSLHQRQAIQAVIRRRMRGLSPAPTRNGALPPSPLSAASRQGAGSPPSPSPATPSDPPVLVAGFVASVAMCLWGLIVWAALLEIPVLR